MLEGTARRAREYKIDVPWEQRNRESEGNTEMNEYDDVGSKRVGWVTDKKYEWNEDSSDSRRIKRISTIDRYVCARGDSDETAKSYGNDAEEGVMEMFIIIYYFGD